MSPSPIADLLPRGKYGAHPSSRLVSSDTMTVDLGAVDGGGKDEGEIRLPIEGGFSGTAIVALVIPARDDERE